MSREVTDSIDIEIHSEEDLLQVFEDGARPINDFKIGIEFERIVVDCETGKNLPFQGASRSIENLLLRFAEKSGWEKVFDQGKLISLTNDGSAITLEPGGQLEISANAHANLQESCKEILALVKTFDDIAGEMGVFYSRSGVPPVTTLDQATWVPKSRYAYMRNFHKSDVAFLEMMALTASVQINYDYESEADCADKIQASSYLSPILAALYANSFYEEGGKNGYCTRRMQIWDQLDPNRSGIKPFFVDGTFGFEKYRDYMMDVPMYFVSRQGQYKDVGHITFRKYLETKPLGPALMQDWLLHLTTTFPEVRLKNHLEFRSIDSNPLPLVMSSAAMIKALMYHPENVNQINERFAHVSSTQVRQAIHDVALKGMEADFAGSPVWSHVQFLYALAQKVLDETEQKYLANIYPYVEQKQSPAQMLLSKLDFTDPKVWKVF